VNLNSRPNIAIIGDCNTGKTSICAELISEQVEIVPTYGAKYYLQDFAEIGQIGIWDLSGDGRFAVSRKKYLLDSNAAIIVYDVANQLSYEHVTDWIEQYITTFQNSSRVRLLLLENKVDLLEENPELTSKLASLVQEIEAKFGDIILLSHARTTTSNSSHLKIVVSQFIHGIGTQTQLKQKHMRNHENQEYFQTKAYLMTFDEYFGPVTVTKSPRKEKEIMISDVEMSSTVRLFSVLQFEDMVHQAYRFGIAPWAVDNSTMYYIAFTLPNNAKRGYHDLYAVGVCIKTELNTLIAQTHDLIEAYLMNTINSFVHHLKDIEPQISTEDGITVATITDIDLNTPLRSLRDNIRNLISLSLDRR